VKVYLLAIIVISFTHAAAARDLPAGFVRLSAIAPTVVQDMRYASAGNFTERPLPGYKAPACILARPVAEALQRVQSSLAERGLSLKVFDCYRPRDAVAAMLDWVNRPDESKSRYHYPRVARSELVRSGYISPVSAHSQGTAVDLTIVRTGAQLQTDIETKGVPPLSNCTEKVRGEKLESPHELDMGTSFDCFDPSSHAGSNAVSATARANRKLLARVMSAEGFRGISTEWWHFHMPLPEFTMRQNFAIEP